MNIVMLSSDTACCVWQIFKYYVIYFFSSPPLLILLVVSGKGAECSARLPTDVAHFSTHYKSFNQTIPPPPHITKSFFDDDIFPWTLPSEYYCKICFLQWGS